MELMKMTTEDINWNLRRTVYTDGEGNLWVKVFRGYMAMEDYVEGGQVVSEPEVGKMTLFGTYTNAEIDKKWGGG